MQTGREGTDPRGQEVGLDSRSKGKPLEGCGATEGPKYIERSSDIKGPGELGDCKARWTWEMCGMQNQHEVGELARGDKRDPCVSIASS